MVEPGALITSSSNAVLKRARKLRRRKRRDEEGAFLVEGIAPVLQALEAGVELDTLIVAPELLTSSAAEHAITRSENAGIRVVRVSASLFEGLSDRDHPMGLAAIARASDLRLRDLEVAQTALFVALENVGNPGNLGTIIRSVDAAGGSGVIATGGSTDPWHPTTLKASMGTAFRLPLVSVEDVGDVLAWAHDVGLAVITTSAHAEQEHWNATFPSPALLLFGSEGAGLAPEVIEAGDMAVRIPMSGSATSLNLAVAVGILLYEARRPR